MFFSSVRVRSSSLPSGRTDTLTSKRIEPLSSSASDRPSSTTVCRNSCRNRFAVSASCRSGSVTISTSGVPPRLKSTSVAVAPWSRPDAATCTFFAASSSRCARVIPIVIVAVRGRHGELPVRAERLVVLADLVALRQVGIEVVLPVEDGAVGDRAVEREAELDALLDRPAVRQPAALQGTRGTPGRRSCSARRRSRCGNGRTSSSPSSAGRGSPARSRVPSSSQPLRNDVEVERALERMRSPEERVL